MPTKVWITEEYGFREWLWIHPGDIDDVVADWKAGRIPPQVHVYQYNRFAERQTEFRGTCDEWDPRLPHWQKLESDAHGRDEVDPYLRAAIEMHTRATEHGALCREHGVIVTAHCHEWNDTSLRAMGVSYLAWWTPEPWECARG